MVHLRLHVGAVMLLLGLVGLLALTSVHGQNSDPPPARPVRRTPTAVRDDPTNLIVRPLDSSTRRLLQTISRTTRGGRVVKRTAADWQAIWDKRGRRDFNRTKLRNCKLGKVLGDTGFRQASALAVSAAMNCAANGCPPHYNVILLLARGIKPRSILPSPCLNLQDGSAQLHGVHNS